MSIESVFSSEGPFAKRLEGFEFRPEQKQMADAIEKAFAENRHLLVEAGTGVGKSFAYLVPAIEQIDTANARILISTNTIALQEQLLRKDIPFLQAVLPQEFSTVLAKGRSNYVCKRRLTKAAARAATLFDDLHNLDELEKIRAWAFSTSDGSLQDLDPEPHHQVWSEVAAEQNNCLGKKSPFYGECNYQMARRRMYNADLLIVNHHLLLSDLSLRVEGSNFLPEWDFLIIDEAHSFERAAAEHLGIRVSGGQIRYLLDRLHNPRKHTGFLQPYMTNTVARHFRDLRKSADAFFDDILRWNRTEAPENRRLRKPHFVQDTLSEPLMQLYHYMAELIREIEDESEELEFRNHMTRVLVLAEDVRKFLEMSGTDYVYWVECQSAPKPRWEFHAAPLQAGGILREFLFDKAKSVILTSATMTTGKSKSFEYVRENLGLGDCPRTDELSLGSPFDYEKLAQIHLPADMPQPKDSMYESELQKRIPEYLKLTDGHAFVLFTSHGLMNRVYENLLPAMGAEGWTAFKQGEGLSPSRLIEKFKSTPRSVLFGTDSFWQGIDVAGDALQNVIITKLPFPVPNQPVVEAKSERIDAKYGPGSAFMRYHLPEAAIKLKQGFGRLIRRSTDKGIVVILDSRVLGKSYGRMFIDSLPKCTTITTSPGAEFKDEEARPVLGRRKKGYSRPAWDLDREAEF